MTRPTFYRIEIEHRDGLGLGNGLGFCHAADVYRPGRRTVKPMRSDRGDGVLGWLRAANSRAVDLEALCWFTPEGWRKFEETGDMAKVFHRLVHFGVPYRVRRIPTDKVQPLYSDGLQALLPRHI